AHGGGRVQAVSDDVADDEGDPAAGTPSMSGAGTGVGVAARVTAGAEGTVGAEGAAWAEVAGATPATTAAIRVAPAARRRCGDTVT
ncbi:hypothetical protein ABZ509_26010, partial [Streptomyces lavendulocolor]